MTAPGPVAGSTLRDSELPVEQFPVLKQLRHVAHFFTTRVPGVEVAHDKAGALKRLDGVHHRVRSRFGLGGAPFISAQQVHGSEIAVVSAARESDECLEACDGLVTNQTGVCLGIYVADCCAVYLVDPMRRAIGLVHSGKNGTALGIVGNAIERMARDFNSVPDDLVVQLSPCIRPPHYEIDFAAQIVRQCREHGVENVHDCGVCTACDLNRYYSYRAEKGQTGRMLALLALLP